MDLELRDHLETTDLCPSVVDARRLNVRERVLEDSGAVGGGDFDRIAPRDLTCLYDAYDHAFFAGLLHIERLRPEGVMVGLRLSKRLTRTAGITQRRHLGADL